MMRPDQDPLLVEQMHAAAYRSTRRAHRNAHVGTLGMGFIRTFPLNSVKKYFFASFVGLRIFTLFIFIRIKALF